MLGWTVGRWVIILSVPGRRTSGRPIGPLPQAAMLLQQPSAPGLESLVGSAPLFAELTDATRAAVSDAMRVVDLAQGESPFGDEDRIDALYIVRHGSLRAIEKGPAGEVLVRTIGPGELL